MFLCLILRVSGVDYNPAVFFFDPFIHYEPEETDSSMDEEFMLPSKPPRRLASYFPEAGVTVDSVRRFFRAAEQNEAVKKQRLKTLAALYLKRIGEQFPRTQRPSARTFIQKRGTIRKRKDESVPGIFRGVGSRAYAEGGKSPAGIKSRISRRTLRQIGGQAVSQISALPRFCFRI